MNLERTIREAVESSICKQHVYITDIISRVPLHVKYTCDRCGHNVEIDPSMVQSIKGLMFKPEYREDYYDESTKQKEFPPPVTGSHRYHVTRGYHPAHVSVPPPSK